MEEPDFESYNLAELQQVYHRIDRVRFPDRFKKIEDILNDPQKVAKLEGLPSKFDDIEPIYSIVKRKVLSYPKENPLKTCVWSSIGLFFFALIFLYFGEIPSRGKTVYLADEPLVFWVIIGGMSLFGFKYLFVAVYHLLKKRGKC